MKRHKHNLWLLWISLVVIVILAACAADSEALQADSTSPTKNNTQGDTTSEIGDAEADLSTLGFEPGDPNLKASDPNTFSPAAGEPQMVELFAFW
ncbi:MAG: hypothetical protein P8046_14395 [Anaerolineales bacterium]